MVRSVVDTMDGISKSSARVAEIISVIEGIAFQTNILALNAAVEAARAGEQGRGFARGAAEVRSLAQRSSSAAKEIGELINSSVRQVQDGAKQVEVAGKTMDDIVGAVRRVTDIMGEISAASEEQTAGIEQVSLAITQMESVTQQNAALVEQASAAAESLMQQAGGLVSEVARFDLSGVRAPEGHAHAPVVTAAPRLPPRPRPRPRPWPHRRPPACGPSAARRHPRYRPRSRRPRLRPAPRGAAPRPCRLRCAPQWRASRSRRCWPRASRSRPPSPARR